MIVKRIFHSLSVRLQSVSIFLSLVGLFFGVKSYIHIKHAFGEEASKIFYDDLILQIGVAIVVNAIVAYILYKIATKPIRSLGETMRLLTENDLTVEIPYTDEPTEIGSMARKVKIFKENAIEKNTLEKQHVENEKKLKDEKTRTMSELANHFESRVQGIIKEVVTAATELKRVSEQMSGVIGGVSSKATDVENIAGQTSQNVSSVASSAEEMSISVHDVADQIAKSTMAVHAAVGAKDRANEVSRMLETAAGKIGEIVDSIQKIAGQINLLALNAMIESARAGEAGKGFAVVANEVKMLATATTSATEDISNHVVNIQDVSAQVIKSLEAINTAIQTVDSYSTSIAATIKQQTAATNEIASNMSAAAGRTKQIVTDIGDVKTASAGANVSANHVFEAVKILYIQTEKLSKEVVGFLGEIRSA